MATTDSDADAGRRKLIAICVLTGVAVIAAVILYFALRSPPQMGTSDAVFNTVDALYTAVRNEDMKRVEECEQRLRGYREVGKLPRSAADKLDRIIATTKSGSWRSAAESLHDFMAGQRREGAIEHDTSPSVAKGKRK